MPDASVIPIGDGRRPPRRRGDRAATQVARAAARAGNERARRRPSGLISPDAEQVPGDDEGTTPSGTTGSSVPGPPLRSIPSPERSRVASLVSPAGWAVDTLVSALGGTARRVAGDDWEQALARVLAFLRRRITGDYDIDEFGFDPELADTVFLSLLRPLYKYWFRVEVRGIENVPAEGGALVVANHSGTVAIDSLMVQVALVDEHPAHRHLRMLGADLVFATPFVAEIARKGGTTLACQADAERLLRTGEVVGVWPEGFKGIGKPFSERYKLQRFGRGGFVSAALRTGVPIIPCSIVGAEEIYPMIGQLPALARLLGVPYFPVTPTFPLLGPLGLVPLPSKWLIEFGEPVPTDQMGPQAADDPMLVFDLTDRVRESIQQTLFQLLVQRRSPFF